MQTIELRCACGAVRGEADFSHASHVHVVCHCGDCERWARHLGRSDANDVVQTAPEFVRITSGVEHVRCARLAPKGLTRWFADGCKTPIANTTGRANVPFVGLMTTTLARKDDAVIGEAHHVNGGRGRTPFGVILRAAWFLFVGFVARRDRPSPFFDASGALISEPTVLSGDGV